MMGKKGSSVSDMTSRLACFLANSTHDDEHDDMRQEAFSLLTLRKAMQLGK